MAIISFISLRLIREVLTYEAYSGDTTRHDTTRHDTTRHHTTLHDTTRHHTTRRDTTGHDTTRRDTTRHHTTGHYAARRDTTRHDTARHDSLLSASRGQSHQARHRGSGKRELIGTRRELLQRQTLSLKAPARVQRRSDRLSAKVFNSESSCRGRQREVCWLDGTQYPPNPPTPQPQPFSGERGQGGG